MELSTALVRLLLEKGLTISTAESCTGGLIAKCITDVSGASAVFYGGVVSYDNSVKENVLSVNKDILNSLGAVSAPVACQMASGVKRIMKTDIGISTTGIAGPGGGTPEKPVGTVYIGFAYGDRVESELLTLDPTHSRDEIRNETVSEIIRRTIEKICQSY